jgi:hypothetical protein
MTRSLFGWSTTTIGRDGLDAMINQNLYWWQVFIFQQSDDWMKLKKLKMFLFDDSHSNSSSQDYKLKTRMEGCPCGLAVKCKRHSRQNP